MAGIRTSAAQARVTGVLRGLTLNRLRQRNLRLPTVC